MAGSICPIAAPSAKISREGKRRCAEENWQDGIFLFRNNQDFHWSAIIVHLQKTRFAVCVEDDLCPGLDRDSSNGAIFTKDFRSH
jgi:hypothetical protein